RELLKLVRDMHRYLVQQGMEPTDIDMLEDSTISDPCVLDDDPDLDDIEFGMTDEQKQRMAEAVALADARTKEVPKEEWNHEDRLQASQTPDW
ncbi:hypothetical protein RZS08_24715, partial [Arthrospira platensis SPKY1]|nr:hypothetical protein [Arthrospira platensis SPKY1]